MRNAVLTTMLAGALLISGCGKNKLTQANYDKVQPGMTLSQVQQMFGSGDKEDAGGGYNMGATGLSGSTGRGGDEVYVWRSGDSEVKVTVRDGKVVDKVGKGLQ